MIRNVMSKAMSVGRFASAVFGLALVLGLVFGVGTMALAAVPGDPLKLGEVNPINTITRLAGNTNNPMLRINNASTGANATALDLQVAPGKPPMKVNSDARVANLNADKIDNRGANQLVRVASFNGNSSLPAGAAGTVAKTTINAPAPGFLVIQGGSEVANFSAFDQVACRLEVDDENADGSFRTIVVDSDSPNDDCSSNAVVPVSAGQHNVEFESSSVDSPTTRFSETSLSAIYVPFGATGSPPSP